jgi:hypothetical protein
LNGHCLQKLVSLQAVHTLLLSMNLIMESKRPSIVLVIGAPNAQAMRLKAPLVLCDNSGVYAIMILLLNKKALQFSDWKAYKILLSC